MLNYYLKLSLLSFKRTPMITLLMILAVGLGIGVSMTVLTVNYLMAKDPIPNKSQLLYHVQLYTFGKGHSSRSTDDQFPLQVTYQDAMNIHKSAIPKRKTRSLLTGFSVIPDNKDTPPFLEAARASDNEIFAMFEIPFLFGSSWDSSIDIKAKPVVVIGKSLNDKLFQGKNSVGQQINLSSVQYTITGVIDDWRPTPHFYDLNNGRFGDSELIFVPFSLLPTQKLSSWGNNNGWKTETINTYEDKLRSEVMWNQYWVEFDNLEEKASYLQWLENYILEQKRLGRFEHEKAGASLKTVTEWIAYNEVVSEDNSILVGLSFMFLAVCLINTIGLLLAKFLKRAPEIGVRRALGANKIQIFIQHLVDVGLIGLIGGLVGLVFGQLGLLGIKSLYRDYSQLVYMDSTLIVSAILIALVSSLLAGIYPAWLICRTNPSVYLKIQ